MTIAAVIITEIFIVICKHYTTHELNVYLAQVYPKIHCSHEGERMRTRIIAYAAFSCAKFPFFCFFLLMVEVGIFKIIKSNRLGQFFKVYISITGIVVDVWYERVLAERCSRTASASTTAYNHRKCQCVRRKKRLKFFLPSINYSDRV